MSSPYLPATTDSLALATEVKDPSEAISILYRVLDDPSSSPDALHMKECCALVSKGRLSEIAGCVTLDEGVGCLSKTGS